AALGSTEAIVLRTACPGVPAAPPGRRVGVAAAELAAAVLAPIADAYDRAEALRAGWVEPLAERHFRPAGEAGGPVTGTTRVGQ
ncbi:MAG TPA: hypothetical protein VES42_00140, partial [Pilimelia sp.]|nr:hypothetical protein [Pilimelia sp.]